MSKVIQTDVGFAFQRSVIGLVRFLSVNCKQCTGVLLVG